MNQLVQDAGIGLAIGLPVALLCVRFEQLPRTP
jgi:hypothetical protein